jgi:hypothetical protein
MVNPDLLGLRFMVAPSGWKCRNQAIAPHLKGERDCLNIWIADDAFAKILSSEHDDFSWAAKRNELRHQREARRKQAA